MRHSMIEFDWEKMPNVADNIWNAQMAGWERVLTYRGPLPHAMGQRIRSQTMAYESKSHSYKIPTFPKNHVNNLVNSRDEYPFACTAEGAGLDGRRQPWIGHVPPVENSMQGGMLRAFFERQGITAAAPNNKFEVKIINHPRGPVRPLIVIDSQ